MKITQEREDVLVGGAVQTDAFTIKASAKAFQILSSNLYSNPLGSMIRELSTNAYDAHIMVDKADEPFTIKMPNTLEPTFKIRDFGPGLSEQEIKTVYTTFFESTKTDSNDVVGCLGLGSKSPFGVADSFTINSFYNGTKTIYSAFLNEQRIPSIAKFHSEPTDQENGIEIEVAIKEEDINTFAKEVNHQLKYFKVKPIITGNSAFEWRTEEEYLYEGTNWKMVDTNKSHHGGQARVVQGQISYPINTNDMGRAFENASSAVRNLLTRAILFEVPIGDVNIAPSREALSYDEATNINIIKAAEKVVEELPGMIAKAIQDAPSEWEARIKYSAIMSDLGGGYYGSNALRDAVAASGQILWKKKDVSETDILLRKEYAEKITGFDKDYNGRYRKNNYYVYADHYNKFKGKKKQDEQFWTVTARKLDNSVVIYATPDDKAVEGRSKQYANDNLKSNCKIIIITTNKSYTSIKRILGIPTLVKAADLPKVRRNTSGSPTKKTGPVEIPVQQFYSSWNKTDQWETHYVEDNLLELEGYYIRLDRYDAEYDGRTVEIKKYWEAAKQMGLVDEKATLWGLRKTNQKREHNLVDFFQHCKTEIENKKSGMTGMTYGDNSYTASKIENNSREVEELITLVDKNSTIYPFLEKVVQYKEVSKNSWDARQLLDLLGFNQTDKKEDVSDLTKDLDEKYPMIHQMSSYSLPVKVVAQYIQQMDRLAELDKEA
jgi:hypothetical protein